MRNLTEPFLWALAWLLALTANVADCYCPQGSEWIEYNRSCYRWSKAPLNWFGSELSCKRFGGHLVSIGSQSDSDFLLRLTQCSVDFWIGLVNTAPELRPQVSVYEWWDGSSHNYSALAPQNATYHDCVASSPRGSWRNVYCQNQLGFVCKAPSTAVSGRPEDEGGFKAGAAAAADDNEPLWWWHPTYETGSTEAATLEYSTPSPNTVDPTPSDSPTPDTPTDGTTAHYETTVEHPTDAETDSATKPTTEVADTTREFGTTTEGRTSTDLTTRVQTTATDSPNARCPPGWRKLDESCYYVSWRRTNYFNAQMSCQAMGASVASILTPREHTLLTILMGCNSPAWIGLEKARPCFRQPNRDHCWVWMDRSPVNYFEWGPGQSADKRDSECVYLNGQWWVTNCFQELPFICKRRAFANGASGLE